MAPTAKAARQEGKRDVEYELRLRVHLADGGTAEVEHTTEVPALKVPSPGQRVPVTVSAADPAGCGSSGMACPTWPTAPGPRATRRRRGDAAGAAEALGFTLRDPGDTP